MIPHGSVGEKLAATKLVDVLLAEGCTISIHDCEEWAVIRSEDRDEILKNLASTGIDTLRLRMNGEVWGTFSLVWGNHEDGSELISDYTYNPFCEEVYKKVYPDG